jgi:hypothetical protein
MQKQVRRPFLKRYLKRDEIQRDLDVCDEGLRDALSLFGVRFNLLSMEYISDTLSRSYRFRFVFSNRSRKQRNSDEKKPRP